MVRIAPLLPAIFLASALGCVSYALVKPERLTVQGAYSVEPQIAWTRVFKPQYGIAANEVWTVDGPALESILFTPGLEDGDALFVAGSPEALAEYPVYRSYMSETEIMEFVAESMTRTGAEQMEERNLRPVAFGSERGFRFDFSYLSQNGLEYAGVANAAILDGRLYVILYRGTALHYYEKYLPQVERMLDSIVIGSESQRTAGSERPIR
jgi:hypothetical protein